MFTKNIQCEDRGLNGDSPDSDPCHLESVYSGKEDKGEPRSRWEGSHAERVAGQVEGVRSHSPHSAPALTFRSDFVGLPTGFLFMLPWSKWLVERVEVGLPEPSQLLIIFHSIPPVGPSRAEMSVQARHDPSLFSSVLSPFPEAGGQCRATPQSSLSPYPPHRLPQLL